MFVCVEFRAKYIIQLRELQQQLPVVSDWELAEQQSTGGEACIIVCAETFILVLVLTLITYNN